MALTRLLDAGYATPELESITRTVAGRVGRDPAIEQAKRRLAAEHGISRAEAFELLRRISQTSNRKLRDVARSYVRNE